MSGTEKTPDGRYLIVNGRKWRATDPSIPEHLRQELVNELMTARRLVKSVPQKARHRVQDAKLALGERGEPWWEPPTDAGVRERIAATTCALLRHRQPETVSADDVAQAIGGDDWKSLVPKIIEIADVLVTSGHLATKEKGTFAPGPYIDEPRHAPKS